MFSEKIKNHRKRQQGSSVILVLLFLMVLSAAGMGMMFASNIDTMVNANYKQSIEAYYASKAGLEEARDRIRVGAACPACATAVPPPTIMPNAAAAGGVVYIVNPDNTGAVTPWVAGSRYFDNELCHENFPGLGLGGPFTPNVPCQGAVVGAYYTAYNSIDPNSGTASSLPYKWVRVTEKQVQSTNPWCTDGNCANPTTQVCADGAGNELLLPVGAGDCVAANMQPVYTITSLAMTSTGARRITQQEVADITLPPLPGALVLDGANPAVGTPNSNNYGINGDNANSCHRNPPGANLPAIGTVSAADTTTVDNSLFRPTNYVGVDGTTPDVTNVSSKLGLFSTVGGLDQIISTLTSVADYVGPATAAPWGTSATPKITLIQGDISDQCNGYGILIVTGYLNCYGAYSFTGVILVIGKGNANLQGGGNGTITGGILVANEYDHLCIANDNSCNAQHKLAPSAAPGSPSIAWAGGGSNQLNYDQCMLGIMNTHIGFRTLVTREEMY